MFKFNFDLEDGDLDDSNNPLEPQATGPEAPSPQNLKPFAEIQFEDLLNQLPSVISFSPLPFTLPNGSIYTVARRDLYDARFQVIAQDQDSDEPGSDAPHSEAGLDFLETPSDLVSGVYEGGLKTWECSLDLAAYIDRLLSDKRKHRMNRILELGCGTAVPSLYLLNRLFATEDTDQDVEIHLQDYNELVCRLVTIPNLILSWYMSSASEKFRQSQPESQLDADQDADLLPPADPTQSGDLPITPALTSAFVTALKDHHIRIRTFTGSWDTFDIQSAGGRYDLVLTSETIYRLESLPSLVRLLHRACVGEAHADPDASLTESASALTLSTSPGNYLCLIAAKLVYFGVGGGVSEFINAVELGESGVSGKVKTIWEQNTGVKRCILKVVWRT